MIVMSIVPYDELAIGHSYSISAAIHLMPELNPRDAFSAIEQTEMIPANSIVEVLSQSMRSLSIWYQVTTDGKRGWINSTALVGKTVTHVIKGDGPCSSD